MTQQETENINNAAVTPEQIAEADAANKAKKTKKGKLAQAKEETTPPQPEFVIYHADPNVTTVSLADLVPLDKTPIENAVYAMREITSKHMEQILIAMVAGTEMPPVQVVNTNIGMVMEDGYHRWAANEQYLMNVLGGAELDNIEPVEGVDPGQLNEARKQFFIPCVELEVASPHEMMEIAFRANLAHGLSASPSSRTRYALWLLETDRARPNRNPDEDMSIREASRRANVKHPMVLKALKRIRDSKAKKMVDALPISEEEAAEAEAAAVQESQESKDADEADKNLLALVKAIKWYKQLDWTSTEIHDYVARYVKKGKLTREDVDDFQSLISYFYDEVPAAPEIAVAVVVDAQGNRVGPMKPLEAPPVETIQQ